MTTTTSKTTAHASNVYLFKNGYGMIVKTFEFPPNKDNNGIPVELFDVPANPVHGTFWIQTLSNSTSIRAIRTKKTRKVVDKECINIQDLIEANVGQNVELLITENSTTSQKKEWIAGNIKSVPRIQPESSDEDDDVSSATPTTTGVPIASARVSDGQPRNLILIETTDNGMVALPLSSVQSIRSATLKTTYQRKVFKNCLSIEYKNESGANDIGIMKYLTFGITWAPSYNLTLLSSQDPATKRLRLSSKAVILNDIENMNVDNLFCIVGFPNVSKFASVIDPIISGGTVQEFLNQLNQSESSTRTRHYHNHPSIMSNVMMQQQIVMPLTTSSNYGPDETQQDTNNEDLHLYEFKNIFLNKKQRLMLPIFDIEIPYKDVYHCKIAAAQTGYVYMASDEKKPYEEVWHSVEFENISNFVWTTAPIVITKGQNEQQFIGQDTLTYTLKGSATFVNLTKALDVRVQIDEKVTSTNPTRLTISRVHYQTDTIDGKITVMNFKSEEIVVVINATLMGKINTFSVAPKKDAVKVTLHTVNQHHDVQWEVRIKPKQTLDIAYVRLFNKPV